jgi:hypothetical protein
VKFGMVGIPVIFFKETNQNADFQIQRWFSILNDTMLINFQKNTVNSIVELKTLRAAEKALWAAKYIGFTSFHYLDSNLNCNPINVRLLPAVLCLLLSSFGSSAQTGFGQVTGKKSMSWNFTTTEQIDSVKMTIYD